MKPLILLEGKYTEETLSEFKKTHRVWEVIDIYNDQLIELFEILNPALHKDNEYKKLQDEFINEKSTKNYPTGNWIYFPWNGVLTHTVTNSDYQLLRTNRNKNLITEDEQNVLLNSCVGVFGLSIGSSISTALAYSGIASTFKLAEFDTIATTNLNRLRANFYDVNRRKIDVAEKQIYSINPYCNIIKYENGIDVNTIENFLIENVKTDVIFDEMDDFEMKIRIRLSAKKAKVPVVMFTNIGDNILLDVERFDEDNQIDLFNGLLGSIPEDILNNKISELDKVKYAIKIVGIENIPTRALESLLEIKKTLTGRPQLNGTITASSGIATYIVRKILLKEKIKSGRYLVSLDKIFELNNEESNNRSNILNKLNNILK